VVMRFSSVLNAFELEAFCLKVTMIPSKFEQVVAIYNCYTSAGYLDTDIYSSITIKLAVEHKQHVLLGIHWLILLS